MKKYRFNCDGNCLLAADIDGTLLGDINGEKSIKSLMLEKPDSFILAFVTGRPFSSVENLVELGKLPQPNYICSSVGTEIVDCNDPDNKLGIKYNAESIEYDFSQIYEFGTGTGIEIQDFPYGHPRSRAGFDWDGDDKTLNAFYDRLSAIPNGIEMKNPSSKMLSSTNCGYSILPSGKAFIDIVPEHLGKGKSIEFLQNELNLRKNNIVVAGDSGNDRQMFEFGYKGILPVNALEELKNIANEKWHYHSKQPVALGVIEGLEYFKFIENC